MPESFQQRIQKVRGPQKAPRKIQTTIRFDPDVLAALKATGRGWQTRVNDALREWLKQQT
nr:BrnA antitoxin family protein [Alcaligenes endophyticus]